MDFDQYAQDKLEILKRKISAENDQTVLIPYLLEALNEYVHIHYDVGTIFVRDKLLTLGEGILPYLNISNKDPLLIHYLAYNFFSCCQNSIIIALHEEIFMKISEMDFYEYTDISLSECLLQRGMYTKQIQSILIEKQNKIIRENITDHTDEYLVQPYLDEVQRLINIYPN